MRAPAEKSGQRRQRALGACQKVDPYTNQGRLSQHWTIAQRDLKIRDTFDKTRATKLKVPIDSKYSLLKAFCKYARYAII